jgi:hypothetical protein
MNTSNQFITVNDIKVQVVRKDIKNLHLGVYPPDGKVRVAVPKHITDENIRLAVVSKFSWIKKQQAKFAAQPRQSRREMVTGESHYLFGRRYLLEVVEWHGRHEITKKNNTTLVLYVKPGTSEANRRLVINEWYRSQLKKNIPGLLKKWEPVIGKEVREWGVKRMKTRWGSCNRTAKRIWLNLELAKKPPECLEYVLVHELVHLLERNHTDRFRNYMGKFIPKWRMYRDLLNSAPLVHEDWIY